MHEWVSAYAGSEQVFEAIARIFPEADLFALSVEPDVHLSVAGRSITTTFLDRPSLRKRRSATLPLMPVAWRTIKGGPYDFVLTSHHAFAHANRLTRAGSHLCYVHSPARYVWSPEVDGRGAPRHLAPARRLLQSVDRSLAKRVTAYAANSNAVARRIEAFWDREAEVIFPPVRVNYFASPADRDPSRDYVLGVGRWIPYKNLHLVIEAADRAQMPVKIAGRGPDHSRLIAAANAARVPVELIESPNDDELRDLYRNATCLVFPTNEDFGIVPVEAQAAGTPVVALAEGGALDTVLDGVSGVFADSTSPADLADAVRRAASIGAAGPRANAAKFSEEEFTTRLLAWVARTLETAPSE